MKKKHIITIVLAFVLCVAMVLPFVPINADAQEVNNFDITNFKSLNFSLIGDSISTYAGVNNNASYNPDYYTYNGVTSRVYYNEGNNYGVTKDDTWWQQAVDTLGMNLLVNNAWSGSAVYYEKGSTEGAYLRRSAYLHNGSTKPDIIALYLGTNDCSGLTDAAALGTVNSALFTTAETYVNKGTGTIDTVLEAYAVMLYRAMITYSDAEIYCFTLLPKLDPPADDNVAVYAKFNEGVAAIVDHYSDKNVYLVDLYNDSGIHTDITSRTHCLANNLHPNAAGMDAITNCFISSMIRNSKYMDGNGRSVSYDLGHTYVEIGNAKDGEEMYGDVTAAVLGKPFSVKFGPAGIDDIKLTVTMDGQDITDEAVRGDQVIIDNVTGDISIVATDYENFYWVAGEKNYISNPHHDATFNYNALTSLGTYGSGGVFGYTSGSIAGHFQLSKPAVLRHDRPWVLEFEAAGTPPADYANQGYKGGILFASNCKTSPVNGNVYIHLNQTQFLIGYRYGGGYNNTGYNWTEIAEKLGSSSGDLFRNESHKYRLENRVNPDGSNMIYLFVDDTEIGPMNEGAAKATELSGKDMVINYFGTENHSLQACTISYIKIFENGETVAEDKAEKFRWNGIGESLTTEEYGSEYTENVATIQMGTGVNGVHLENSYYTLDKPINLLHDRPWIVEWRAKGGWGRGAGESPMLFATQNVRGSLNAAYVWRNDSDLLAFGAHNGSAFQNYGINLSSQNLSDSQNYVYRLENRITYNADGTYASNMVYLYIDGVEIGAMDDHFNNGNAVAGDTENTWLNGKDFEFSYIGTKDFPLNDVTIDYIMVLENGSLNTDRLAYLINNALEKRNDYTQISWNAYDEAIKAGSELIHDKSINQDQVDAAVAAIMDTRSKLVASSSETKIYKVELVTGNYARVGKQTGLRVITSPDVAQIGVGSQTFIVNTCQIQELLIDGVKTTVKVWLVSFQRTYTSEKTVSYTVAAYTDPNASHDVTTNKAYQASTTIKIPYKSRYAVSISVTTQPTKTVYVDGEEFDTTGMVITATMSDGTTEVISKRADDGSPEGNDGYFLHQSVLHVGVEFVTIEYEGETVSIPVTVQEKTS